MQMAMVAMIAPWFCILRCLAATWLGLGFHFSPNSLLLQAGVSLGQASVLAARDRCQMEYQTVYCWGSECNFRSGRLGVGWCGRLLGL